MNERLTIQDLIDLLATKHSMTKKDADAFVKEFFLLIEQALDNEKTVKIKGLGTFKLVDVDSRESINVNSGERFQIKGHTKVSFTPDTSLRDTINKPFAHFETVVLNDSTILEDTPSDESDEEEETGEETLSQSLEIASPENNEKEDNEVEKEVSTPDHRFEPKIVVAPEEKPIELLSTSESYPEIKGQEPEPTKEEIKEKKKENETESELTAEEIIAQELHKAKVEPMLLKKPEVKHQSKKTSHASVHKDKSAAIFLITTIVIVLALCGGAILYIYYPDLFSNSENNIVEAPETPSQPTSSEVQLVDTVANKDSVTTVKEEVIPAATKEQVPTKPVTKEILVPKPVKEEHKDIQSSESANVYLDSATYKITGTKTKYTIKEGETLTRVSLRFYGTKGMWPYIVKHNPKVIKNPDNVPYGTTIEIPELTKQ